MNRSSAIDRTVAPVAAPTTTAEEPVGVGFAEALGRKDFDGALALLDARVDFRGLTPGRTWQAADAPAVGEILRQWFEDTDLLEEIVSIDSDSLADRQRVAYRFRGRNPDGGFLVEQQADYTAQDGRIDYMRVLCSGFRPGQP